MIKGINVDFSKEHTSYFGYSTTLQPSARKMLTFQANAKSPGQAKFQVHFPELLTHFSDLCISRGIWRCK